MGEKVPRLHLLRKIKPLPAQTVAVKVTALMKSHQRRLATTRNGVLALISKLEKVEALLLVHPLVHDFLLTEIVDPAQAALLLKADVVAQAALLLEIGEAVRVVHHQNGRIEKCLGMVIAVVPAHDKIPDGQPVHAGKSETSGTIAEKNLDQIVGVEERGNRK